VTTTLFAHLFDSAAMDRVFSDRALIQRWVDVEAALARAQANLGLIPEEAALEIAAKADAELFDTVAIAEAMATADHPLVPTIWRLSELCGEPAGRYVHWGATTQDIMDTAMVLQIRDGLDVLERHVDELLDAVAELTRGERDTLMAGRTHGQQALPITFGLKSASWLDELLRHRARAAQLRERALCGQLAGASGTLASLGEHGSAVLREFCRVLDLGVPMIGWHVARDNLAELAHDLAMLAATCGRIAGEVIQLQKTEIAEAAERHEPGNVGSSTMPHKRNPMTAESVVACSMLARRTSATALEGMLGEHERDMGTWQAEWAWVPELFRITDAALLQTIDVVAKLDLDRARMTRNLDLTDGLLMAERVMIELGRSMGRQQAHELVHGLAMRCVEEGVSFRALLLDDPRIASQLGRDDLDDLLDVRSYLGATQTFIDAVLSSWGARYARVPARTAVT
jgi:3-carboxy-cis,cis-muconate cycloisomerase